MNNRQDIGSYLRENRPQVKENPAFLLEVQQKMHAVDGIKAEVDRQRKHGRIALASALLLGLLAGGAIILLAYLYPVNTAVISHDIITWFRLLIEPYKEFLMITIACCAIIMALVFGTRKNSYS